MSKGTVNIPITHYDDLKSIIGKWKESHTQAINKIAELEKANKTLRAVLPRYITKSDIDKMRDEALKEQE
jgi:hypothetical protein